MQNATIVGNLTADPEHKILDSGAEVTKLRIAVNRTVSSSKGEYQEVSFYNVDVWNGQSVHTANSVTKGDRVIVSGRLKEDRWDAADGTKRSRIVLVADEIGVSLKFHEVKVPAHVAAGGNAVDDPGEENPPF